MSAMKGTPEARAFMAALRAHRKPGAKAKAKPQPQGKTQDKLTPGDTTDTGKPLTEQDVAKRFMQARKK